MMFKRSTRQIVLGRKKAAETAKGNVSHPTMQDIGEAETEELIPAAEGGESYEMEEEQIMEKPKKKTGISGMWMYILIGCLVVILLVLLVLIVPAVTSTSQEKEAEQSLTIPDGMGVVSCESALASQAGAGDVVQLYDAEGHTISELQYVEVLTAGDGYIQLLMDEAQTQAYIQKYGGTAALVAVSGTEQAETLLDYQQQILSPEVALTALTDAKIAPSETVQMEVTATANPTGGILPDVVWQSGNPAIATVTQEGLVTAVDVGSTVITASCGETSVSCTVTVRVTLEGLSLSQSKAELGIGETLTLTAAPNPENATDFSVIWSVDNSDVATIAQDGTVTAVSAGTAVVTAQCGELTASCTVTVGVDAEMIQLDSHTLEMLVDGTAKLTYSLYPSEGVIETPVFSSSDESIATVAQDGTITAIKTRQVTITVTCGDVSDTCTVTVYT